MTASQLAADGKPALRIALLTYRGNPRCGGQGVYCNHLSESLAALGHHVTVFSGQPYPVIAPGVDLVRVPSLDLYRDADPFRLPKRREISSVADLYEIAIMRAGGFPEPRTFGLRVRKELESRRDQFDIVHDNQSLSHAIEEMVDDKWPLIASIHHPISVDRSLDLQHEHRRLRRFSIRRWYGFVRMQKSVARAMTRIITVSSSARADIAREFNINPERIFVVPVGVDTNVYRPHRDVQRIADRIMTTASADVPLKGLMYLLEALAKIRTERENAHLIVIGKLKKDSPINALLDRLSLRPFVTFVAGETDEEIARRYSAATVAVVPSLYEGFSLPAIEAMACGVPLIATTGGALPEVVGTDGKSAILVPPGDPEALAGALREVLGNPDRATSLGQAGMHRVLNTFSWKACAEATVAQYREYLSERS